MRRAPLGIVPFAMVLLLASCTRRAVVIEGARQHPKGQELKGVYHVVQRHQTLYRICKTYNVDIHEVARLNRIPDQRRIFAGQRIFIPGAKKVLNVEIYIDDLIEEQIPAERGISAPVKLDFIWPVRGPCSAGFDPSEQERHMGVDIPAPPGTPVRAAASGVVIYSGSAIKGYGNLIVVRHRDGWSTVYAHNRVNLVDEGETVEKGQIIAEVGQTGKTSGPHLHFELRRHNIAVDPVLYLK